VFRVPYNAELLTNDTSHHQLACRCFDQHNSSGMCPPLDPTNDSSGPQNGCWIHPTWTLRLVTSTTSEAVCETTRIPVDSLLTVVLLFPPPFPPLSPPSPLTPLPPPPHTPPQPPLFPPPYKPPVTPVAPFQPPPPTPQAPVRGTSSGSNLLLLVGLVVGSPVVLALSILLIRQNKHGNDCLPRLLRSNNRVYSDK